MTYCLVGHLVIATACTVQRLHTYYCSVFTSEMASDYCPGPHRLRHSSLVNRSLRADQAEHKLIMGRMAWHSRTEQRNTIRQDCGKPRTWCPMTDMPCHAAFQPPDTPGDTPWQIRAPRVLARWSPHCNYFDGYRWLQD